MVSPEELQDALIQSIANHSNSGHQSDHQSDQDKLSIASSSVASVKSKYHTPSSASSVGNSPPLHALSTSMNNQSNALSPSSIPLFTLDFPERVSEQVIKQVDGPVRNDNDDNDDVIASAEEERIMMMTKETEEGEEGNTILPPVHLLCFAQTMTTLKKMKWSSMELVEVDIDYAMRTIRLISAISELDLSLPIRQVCGVHIVENAEKVKYLCLQVREVK